MNRIHRSGILTLMCCLVLLAACKEEPAATETVPKPIMWIKTQTTDLSQVRRISGVLQAAESADLSFEVSGKVKEVSTTVGDEVKKGQVLAELDEASYQLTRKSAEGSLKEASAGLVEAQNEFKRQSDLFEKGWVSKARLDNARAALDTASSAVEVAKAQLDLTNEDLADTSLRAPYEGKIVARLIEPSQTVRAGETVLQIEGYGELEVSALVPETIITNLERGQMYDTQYPVVPNLSIKAQITEIGSRAEAANAFPVTLTLQETNEALRGGMTVEVDFTFGGRGRTGYEGETVKIPPTAILPGADQKTYAFVFDETTGVVRKREIQTENIIDNDILISNGLKAGEIIAVVGVEYLHDGQSVRLMGVGPKQFN